MRCAPIFSAPMPATWSATPSARCWWCETECLRHRRGIRCIQQRTRARPGASGRQRRDPMKVLRGKKALVTGAASGIGRAIALALAREGVDLYLVDIDDRKIDAVAGEARRHGVEVRPVHCDLAQPKEITALVENVLRGWGRLNILVNNAGVAHRGPTHQMSSDEWNRLLAVNLMAPIQLVREFLPILRSNEAHILNVCSIFGLVSTRKSAAYQTSKFALVGLSAALRAEYGSPAFGVTALCPGFAHTPLV